MMLYMVCADAEKSSCMPLKAQLVQRLSIDRLAEAGLVFKEVMHLLPLDIFLHNIISLSNLIVPRIPIIGIKPLLFSLDCFLVWWAKELLWWQWRLGCPPVPLHPLTPLTPSLHGFPCLPSPRTFQLLLDCEHFGNRGPVAFILESPMPKTMPGM